MNGRRELERQRDRFAKEVPDLTQVLRGSLFERKRRCGVPTCHCATGDGHPTVVVGVTMGRGKTIQVTVPPELVPTVRRWTETYRTLTEIIERISTANRELLRLRLVDPADMQVPRKLGKRSPRRTE